jgi:uncharacterized repeat protein (TIGR01451 family)
MSNPKRNHWSVLMIIVLLVGAIGLLTALMPTNRSQAAGEGPGTTTFISPTGDPQLSLSKQIDNTAPTPGTLINYTLSYSNTNPGSTAFAVRLYDFLPAGVQYIASYPLATPYPNGMLLFAAPSVGPGTENHNVTVQVKVLEGYEQLTNHALVSADGVTPATASVNTTVYHPWGELSLDKVGPTAALINMPIIYVLTCHNPSAATLNDVSLSDVLPAGVTYVNAAPAPDAVTVPLLRWSLGNLAPGESRSVVITTMAPANDAAVVNTALADARQLTMVTALHTTQVVTQAAILRVSKEASASAVNVGDVLVYTLHYSNVGNQPTTDVVLTDTLPAGITLVSANPPWTAATSQFAAWNIGPLAAGASEQIVLTTTVNGPWNRTLHNVADITGAAGSFPEHTKLDTIVQPAKLYLPVVRR